MEQITTPSTKGQDVKVDRVAAALVDIVEGENSFLVADVLDPLPNFWDIIDYGDQAGEIRYSKMIGWLLNPQENHGLGTAFAQRFVDAAFGEDAAPTISPRAKVLPREWRSIDVLLVDYDTAGEPTLTLVIENKTDSVEHPRSGLDVGQTVWYNWVVRSDFASIEDAIARANLEKARETRLRRQLARWKKDQGGYTEVPDEGRHFVYLTPRADDVATDAEFKTLTYAQLELMLSQTADELAEAGRADAEKLVRDFHRSIHRRFNVKLDAEITALYEGGPVLVGEELRLLASWFGLHDEKVEMPEDFAGKIFAAMNEHATRTLSEIEFQRLVEHVWDRRPRPVLNDTSKFYWGERSNGKFVKIDLLQQIARAFVKQRGITSVAEFEKQFGDIVQSVVDPNGANPFVGAAVIYDPDQHRFSPSAEKRYKAGEAAMRDRIGAIEFGDGRYRVHWNLGCKSDRSAGRLVHLPVIAHFINLADPINYPIELAK